METKEKPKPSPDYLMQLMNDKKLMSSLPNFCGIFNHLERLLDEGKTQLQKLKTEQPPPPQVTLLCKSEGEGENGGPCPGLSAT